MMFYVTFHQIANCYFSVAATALTSGFMDGIGHIWLSNVQCSGTESRLIDCDGNTLGSQTCDHSQDAGVLCSSTTCTQGAIRLQGGSGTQGRVEICNNNVWGTVCDDNWGEDDAQVACRQLGFTAAGTICCHPLLLLLVAVTKLRPKTIPLFEVEIQSHGLIIHPQFNLLWWS